MEYHTIIHIIEELQYFSKFILDEEVQKILGAIESADRIFVAGAGRSGFAARAFANRLMHLGCTSYFVGEPTTPPIKKGDLLYIGSGSGMTAGLVALAEKARSAGASLATVTLNKDGEIGRLADTVLCLPGTTRLSDVSGPADRRSIQPVGSMFEQLSWLVYDSIILDLSVKTGQSFDDLIKRHGNLE